jgi:hypothetical protein
VRKSFLAVHRCTERKRALGYAENAETLRTTDYADDADATDGVREQATEESEAELTDCFIRKLISSEVASTTCQELDCRFQQKYF